MSTGTALALPLPLLQGERVGVTGRFHKLCARGETPSSRPSPRRSGLPDLRTIDAEVGQARLRIGGEGARAPCSPHVRRLVAALIALCLILASAPAGAAERLRVGLTRTPGAGPLLIAAKNYFADEGVDARLVFLPSDALVAKDVASGDLDIGLAELDAAFFAVAAAQHLVLLASAFSDQ